MSTAMRRSMGCWRRGRAGLRRSDGEARVVGRQINVADEGVGLLDQRDPSELELLDQTILQRLERPLRAPSGLRRIGPDVLDPELLPDRLQAGAGFGCHELW